MRLWSRYRAAGVESMPRSEKAGAAIDRQGLEKLTTTTPSISKPKDIWKRDWIQARAECLLSDDPRLSRIFLAFESSCVEVPW